MAVKRRVKHTVFAKKFPGQMNLFTTASGPTAQQFAAMLLGRGLIAANHKRKNVKKIIANAYASIESLKGINANALLQALGEAKQLDVELLCSKAVEPTRRSLKEQWAIKRALKAIVLAVLWKRRADAFRKMHAPTPKEFAGKARQQRHLESIQEQ